MFDSTREEAQYRIQMSQQLLVIIKSIEATKPIEAAAWKGLMFVQMYAIYEYTVRHSVQASLSLLKNAALAPKDLRRELLSLVLDPEWKSADQAGEKSAWDRRTELIAMMDSSQPILTLDETLFPSDGSHYRPRQLYTIWKIFGIGKPIVPDNRLLGRIDEVVENRNAIAHGRRTPEDVGRQHSIRDIGERIDDLALICAYLVSTMEEHCSKGALRKSAAR